MRWAGYRRRSQKARELAKLPADAEVESVGTPRGIWAALGGVATRDAPSAEALASLASPGDELRESFERLAPGIAPFAMGLAPLADGEKTLLVVPFALVIR